MSQEKSKLIFQLTVGEFEELQQKIFAEETSKMLADTKHDPQTVQQKEILNIVEVAELTGYARQTLYAFVSDRKIPFLKRPGSKALRFSRSAILEWLSISSRPAIDNSKI